jgi:hypothetical protein
MVIQIISTQKWNKIASETTLKDKTVIEQNPKQILSWTSRQTRIREQNRIAKKKQNKVIVQSKVTRIRLTIESMCLLIQSSTG